VIASELKERLGQEVESRLEWLNGLYQHFHANPELSGQEKNTAAHVAKEFEALGLEVHSGIGGHGLVGILDNGPGPYVLIRADMDALPIKEITGLPFASQVTAIGEDGQEVGVMHACGHDVHTTILIGVASVLSSMKEMWQGKIMFLGQPAEEAIGGAALMMKDGLYERFGRPDQALALHIDPFVAEGGVSLSPGVQSSCSHALDLTVKGKGGHGASPHRTKDPVFISAQIITALQGIISREKNPSEMGVITVGSIHGGTKRNIIPEEVVMKLTIRAYDAGLADQFVEAIRRTANGIAQANGIPEERWPQAKLVETSYPPIINDPELTGQLESTFKDLLGEENVAPSDPTNGSEDFSYFAQADPPVPQVMFHLGVTQKERLDAAENGGPKVAPGHDPRFYVDLEKGLPTGLKSMAAAVLSTLAKK
jgi:amidohydrolase